MKNYSILEKYCFLFLQWIHENSIYHLKNNLNQVYEYAKNQIKENKPIISVFAKPFLYHSSINRLLYFIEKENETEKCYDLSKQEIEWVFEEIDKMTIEKSEEERQSSLNFVEKWRTRTNKKTENEVKTNAILDFYKSILELSLGINKGNFDLENAPKMLFGSVDGIIKGASFTNNLDFFIEKYISFGINLSEESKSYLSESILINEKENKHKRATQIYSTLKDVYSLTVLLQLELEKTKNIRFELQGI